MMDVEVGDRECRLEFDRLVVGAGVGEGWTEPVRATSVAARRSRMRKIRKRMR